MRGTLIIIGKTNNSSYLTLIKPRWFSKDSATIIIVGKTNSLGNLILIIQTKLSKESVITHKAPLLKRFTFENLQSVYFQTSVSLINWIFFRTFCQFLMRYRNIVLHNHHVTVLLRYFSFIRKIMIVFQNSLVDIIS